MGPSAGRELAEQRHPGRAAVWRAHGNLEGDPVRGLLEHRGYTLARVLYVELVGTHPRARGAGLAQACLRHTVHLADRSGDYDSVELHVDSTSPTRAGRLYERAGFTTTKAFGLYEKPVL